jgi:hypothetical protein
VICVWPTVATSTYYWVYEGQGLTAKYYDCMVNIQCRVPTHSRFFANEWVTADITKALDSTMPDFQAAIPETLTVTCLSTSLWRTPLRVTRRYLYLPPRKNLPVVASTTPWPLESLRELPYMIPHTSSLFLPSQSSE